MEYLGYCIFKLFKKKIEKFLFKNKNDKNLCEVLLIHLQNLLRILQTFFGEHPLVETYDK